MFTANRPTKTNIQISALGSADPKNMEIQEGYKGQPLSNQLINMSPEQQTQMHTQLKFDYDESPNNPIIQNFNSLFDEPVKELDSPEVQNGLFDVDNFVKGQSGIFRTKQEGLSDFGMDVDGKSLWAMADIKDSQDYDLGKNKLYTTGTMLQQMGAFSDEEEADNFAAFTEAAGDPEWMGQIAGMSASGDMKGAVNGILMKMGVGDLSTLKNSEDKKKGYGIAFAAYNYAANVDKLSPSQQSLSLGTIASMAYKFKDGSDIGNKPLIQDAEGNVQLTVGNAMNMAGSGIDVFGLQKNWDQLDAIQRITYGPGGAGQIAATGKRMGILNTPQLGGKSINMTPEDLGKAGFTSVPSAGIGAITGNGDALPPGYEVVAAGQAPGQVIAVPKGLSRTSATINGSAEIRTLNETPGVKKAGIGAFKVHSQWQQIPPGGQNGAIGTTLGTALTESGVTQDPYLTSAVVATSVFGNTVSKTPNPGSFQQAVAMAGTKQGKPKQYNIQQMSKSDQNLNTTIQTSQAVVNTMAKYGNETAKAGAGYVNAVAAGKKLYDVMNNPNATDKEKTEAMAGAAQAGTNIAASMGSQTASGVAPGINVAMAAYGASKVLGSDATPEQKAVALRRTGEDAALAYFTFGIAPIAQYADAQFFGGVGDKYRTKLDSVDPGKIVADKIVAAALGSGGKNKEQQGRDSARKSVKDLTDGNFNLTLTDGTVADIGIDGDGGQHEFRFKDKSMGVDRPLSAYDVDYTNDLDFTSNMMSSALMRLVSGGKGTATDQIAGQMGNAALGKVGFGAEMTEENFAYVRDNIKGWFFKKGIQTKEDAYALNNQMFSEGRATEMDQIAIQQGIDMVFSDAGFDNANMLMAGRWKGLDVASDVSKSPGPNFDLKPMPRPTMDSGFPAGGQGANIPDILTSAAEGAGIEDVQQYTTTFNPGAYGGNKNTDAFTKSIIKYQKNKAV